MPAEISVVVGAQNAKSTISQCLNSVLSQLQGLEAELFVADSSSDGTNSIVSSTFPDIALIHLEGEKLVPHLWGAGIELTTAPIVAITTAHCIPAADWIQSILKQARNQTDCAGVGGAIDPPSNGTAVDWAVYLSRYSAFMPPAADGVVADIPGDNAAYRKEALDRCWTDRTNGFWETLFHHAVRQSGGKLYMSPAVAVRLGTTDSAMDYFHARYKHGEHYGSSRPNNAGPIKLMRIGAAPILMPYLVLRIGARVARTRPDWLIHYIFALPWLIFFMTGWSLGEIQGYRHSGKTDVAS
jgi:glycosyltransferase involved in cell wall biosynthesis